MQRGSRDLAITQLQQPAPHAGTTAPAVHLPSSSSSNSASTRLQLCAASVSRRQERVSARAWERAARRRKKHLEAVTGWATAAQSQQCAPDFASLAQMLLENFLRVRPSFSAAQAVRAEMAQRGGGFRTKQTRLPPGNDGRPDKGAFLATAHTSSNKQNAFSLEIIIATVGVVPVAAHASVDRQRINSSGATALVPPSMMMSPVVR